MTQAPAPPETLRILQLEDSPEDAELEQVQLRRAGLAFLSERVETREAFVAALEEFRPDIVLADYRLPAFDGKSALLLVRQTHPEIPVVVVSGVLGDEGAVELLKAGAHDFVLKDRMGRLGAAVQNALADVRERRLRQQAEQALKESELRFRSLIENTSDIIGIAALDGTIRYASPAVRKISGYEPQDLVGRNYFELVVPEDLAQTRANIAELANLPGVPRTYETRVRHKDGSTRHTESVVRNLLDVPGIEGLVVNIRDVTERKQAEAGLHLANYLIEQSSSILFRWAAAPGWPVVYVSKNLSQWGYAPDELLSGKLPYASLLHPDDLQRVADEVAAHAANSVAKFTQEYRVVQRSGEVIWVEDRSVIERDAAGKPVFFQGVVSDITERRKREATAQAEMRRAQLQLEAIGQVIASPALGEGDLEALARQITEAATRACGAERANVWLFNHDETELRCLDLYEVTPARHSAGMVLKESEFQNEFHALKTARYVDADDPLTDPRTQGYVESYLKPLRISSMLDAVIEASGKHLGLLCIEHVDRPHHWEPDEIAFANLVADKLGLCLANRDRRQLTAELQEAQRVAHLGHWRLDPATGEVSHSEEVSRILGLDPAERLTRYQELMTPDSFARMSDAIAECMRSGEPYELELELTPDSSGARRWLLSRGAAVRDAAGTVVAIRGITQDITEQKRRQLELERTARALRALSHGNSALVHAEYEAQLYDSMCRAIVEAGGYRMAWVGLAEQDEGRRVRPVGQAGAETGYAASAEISWGGDARGAGPTGECIRSGQAQISRDIANDPRMAPWRTAALAAGFKSSISLPLKDASGRTFGVLNIYSNDSAAFDAGELPLLVEMAGDLSYGIGSLRTAAEHRRTTDKLRRSLEGTIAAISSTMEMRDPYTAGHQRRVAALAAAIAKEMGLPPLIIEGVHFGALIHDLGKIQLPAEILAKPARLSKLEYELIKTHPQSGYDIIKDIEFPWPVALMVLQHHERLDGSGYPQGLIGAEISLEARILAVADVVEAMASHRPYRPALGVEAALKEITEQRGRGLDPAAVDACLKLFREQRFTLA